MELGETCCPKHFCCLGIVKGGGHANQSSLVTAAAHGTPLVVSLSLRNCSLISMIGQFGSTAAECQQQCGGGGRRAAAR
jgi:hypothetical protein